MSSSLCLSVDILLIDTLHLIVSQDRHASISSMMMMDERRRDQLAVCVCVDARARAQQRETSIHYLIRRRVEQIATLPGHRQTDRSP